MKGFLSLISFYIISGSAHGQYISFDSLAKSIKAVNVEKVVAEDHIRLIAEVESLNNTLRSAISNYESCLENSNRFYYALNLYQVLDEIEKWDMAKTKSEVINKASYINYDTFPDGKLKSMHITLFYPQDLFGQRERDTLEFEIENHIANNSLWLQSHYPNTSSKIQRQIIVIEKLIPGQSVQNQVLPIIFPSLVVKINKEADKKKIAQLYLDCIEKVCNDYKMQAYSFKEYLRYETKAIPDKNIDKILAIRVAFIKVLKEAYAKKTHS
jgi:hypothetical protein